MKHFFRTKRILIDSVLILFLFSTNLTFAQKEGDDVSLGKYRQIHSNILDEDRLLLVHLPREYTDTELNYPVLYLLYGQDINNYFADAVIVSEKLGGTGEIPPLIIVGIANTNRYRDNLPWPIEGRSDSGGADKFLKFFKEELIPYVDSSYRTKDFRILAGPQAGAVFGLYTLIRDPSLFQAVLSENPFMNAENSKFLYDEAVAFFNETESLNNFLYIKCETDETAKNLDYAMFFNKLLESRNPEGFRYNVKFQEPSGYFIPPLPFLNGLRTLFSGHKLPDGFVADSVHDIILYYKELSEEIGFTIDPPSLILTFEGDRLSQKRKIDEALELFEYQLKLNPKSLNALWRLGETYRGLGDLERARDYYQDFLDIRDTDAAMIRQRLELVERMISSSASFRIEQEIVKNGIESGLKLFAVLKEDSENTLYFEESEFNAMGYRFFGKGKINDALEIFNLNVSMFPDSANVYDSLGEAYMASGDIKRAIKNYTKSLELNPGNTNAEEILKKLKKKDD